MKQRSFFSALIAAVVVLLSIGIGGYYWITSQSPLPLLQGGNQTTPAAAIFVSKQSPVMVSMLVNPTKLESLKQLVTRPRERRRSRQELNQLKSSLLANTGLDYRRDIQPWLGEEITLAVTTADIDRDENNGKQPGYLMVAASKDAAKSREFLELLFSKRAIAGKQLVSEQYKGVNLLYDTQQSTPSNQLSISTQNSKLKTQNYFSGAVAGDRFVVFANHPKVLREAINNVQAPDLSLISSSQYQQALNVLPSRRVGIAFLNLPSVAAWLGKQPEAQTYTSQIIGLELTRQGLLAQTSFLAAPDRELALSEANLSQPVKALEYIPQTTGLTISGVDLSGLENTNLNLLWQQLTALLSGSGNDAISRLVKQPVAALQDRWGINLSQDIFSWVQGEYALAMIPNTDSSTDWIFVAEKSDATAPAVTNLDAIAESRGLSITPLSTEDRKVYAWTQLITTPTQESNSDSALLTLKAKVEGVHTTVGNYEIFTSSVEAMDAALKAAKNDSVLNNPQFQPSIHAIPQPNQGYLYLDWQASRAVLERQLPVLKLLEVAGKPFFNNLRSLTISSYGSEAQALKGGVFLRFNSSSKLAPRE